MWNDFAESTFTPYIHEVSNGGATAWPTLVNLGRRRANPSRSKLTCFARAPDLPE
jgi:hypothetical protein